MKIFLSKYIYLITCTSILIIIGIYGFVHTDWLKIRSNIPITFSIDTLDHSTSISVYQSENNQCYVFLPSYANMNQVKIDMPSKSEITIGNSKIYDDFPCSDFILEKEYAFCVNNRKDMTITFCQSANVATMYIDTATGSMERIHNDKEYEEPSSVTLFLPNGDLSYIDSDCHLKGRGNATWGKEKKPYTLKLTNEFPLLGMAPSTEWVLLANSFDETNLRNKIVYDLAKQTPLRWTPSCRYVDVYLNGTYNGLYLISERIEADENHLLLDSSKDSFLCKVDHSDRWESMRSPFKSSLGRSIELTSPRTLTPAQKDSISSLVNKMESTLLSTPVNETFSNIDLDSWACKYLIDEISGNGDSDLASSYFYYEDGVFYAGPIWDYDNSFGNNVSNENPIAFTAKNYHKAPYYRSPYYDSLYQNKEFYNRMTQLYETEFQSPLLKLLDNGISSMAKNIDSATKMNSIRWESMFDREDLKINTSQELIDYLKLRVDFLNNAWINNIEYCTVQFQTLPNGRYYNFAVKKGDILNISELNTSFTEWYNADTGEPFDVTQPINEDISLVSQHEQ